MKAETLLRYFSQMPPLDQCPLRDLDQPFRWKDSEVVKFFMARHKFMNDLVSQIQKSGAVVFFPGTKKWSGYAYQASHSKGSKVVGSKASLFDYPAGFKSTKFPLIGGNLGNGFDPQRSPYPLAQSSDEVLNLKPQEGGAA